MPDLDLIKQDEQGGAGPARAVRPGPVGQSRRPAARLPRPRQPRCPANSCRGRRDKELRYRIRRPILQPVNQYGARIRTRKALRSEADTKLTQDVKIWLKKC